ncbi:protein kinase domain-containing protein [Apiospora marii]|uniref:protein kinase domain-containing protein n=1 Tax=Apiospora marii TaxID=335849 RepID=UPI00313090D5
MRTLVESVGLGQATLSNQSSEVVKPDGDGTQTNPDAEELSTRLETYSKSTQRLVTATSLERSPNFIPEAYTTAKDPLIFYDSQEVSQSMNHRDVTYTLLLLRRRQFTCVTLHVEINRDSTYWPALRAKPASIGYRKAYEPPATLTDALHKFLQGRKALPQDAQIDLFLGHRQGNFQVDKNPRQKRKTQQYLQQVSAEAVHMSYPRYKERELIHCPVSWKYEAVRLQAKLKSGWVIEVRFNSRDDHMDEELYALKVLYRLRRSNGFGSLVGLVEDDDGRISGFLCRNPSLGPLLDVISRAKQHGTLVDWVRRERWCRQIIQGISELHGEGLRHGSLGRLLRNGLYIDEHDNVVFLNSFRDSFTYADDLQDLSIPPECQDMRDDSGDPVSAIPVHPATDLYQLGLILWCIAANEEAVYRSTVCEHADIEAPEDEVDIGSDSHLPSLDPSKAPPFMNKVIALCRGDKPEERRPAWELLQEFPAPAEVADMPRIRELSVDDEETPAEDDMVAWPINIRCRRCQAPTADHYYHCGRCLIAVYYDICPSCFSDGHHCLDDDHYLQELRKREPQGKYYSCVGGDGRREVLKC